MNAWIVVADASKARVFSAPRVTGPLTEVQTLEHPEGRARAHELVTDRSGSNASDMGGKQALAPRNDPVDVENEKFAHVLVTLLEEKHRTGAFSTLAIAMPPRMLGRVRGAMSKQLSSCVSLTLHERLVDMNDKDIAQHLKAQHEADRP